MAGTGGPQGSLVLFPNSPRDPDPPHPKKRRQREAVYLNPPTVEEVAAYLKERGWNRYFTAEYFVSRNDAFDWMYGPEGKQRPVRSWKALAASWVYREEH